MPKIETSPGSKLHELYKMQIIDRERDSSLLTPPDDYIGPAYLRSELCLIPISIIGSLGLVDERDSTGRERSKFAAQLDSTGVNNRIQGGVWVERVGVKPSVLEKFLMEGPKKPEEKDSENAPDPVKSNNSIESDLQDIPQGYHGSALLILDGTNVPVYVGGIGEETGIGHVRARLDLGRCGQIRLEGEINADKVKARQSDIEECNERQRKWDYKNW
jgi:hypothetical protein